jgi:hypothetical protein
LQYCTGQPKVNQLHIAIGCGEAVVFVHRAQAAEKIIFEANVGTR